MTHHHQINFLPEEYKRRFERARKNSKLIKLALLATIAVGTGLILLKAWETTLSEHHQLAATNLAQLESNLEPFTPIRQTANFINDRLTTIDQLKATRFDWTELVVALARATPPTVQIVSFAPTLTANQLSFTLSGRAASRIETIAFKLALEATGQFHDLLIESSQIAEGSDPTVSFTLTGNLDTATGAGRSATLSPSPAGEE